MPEQLTKKRILDANVRRTSFACGRDVHFTWTILTFVYDKFAHEVSYGSISYRIFESPYSCYRSAIA